MAVVKRPEKIAPQSCFIQMKKIETAAFGGCWYCKNCTDKNILLPYMNIFSNLLFLNINFLNNSP